MTSALTTAREDIADELAAVFPGRNVYAWLPASPVLPCVIVGPDDPPVTVTTYGAYLYRLRIASLIATQAGPDIAATLEDDLTALVTWAGDTATDHNMGPARYGDTTVYGAGLTITVPVHIPQE